MGTGGETFVPEWGNVTRLGLAVAVRDTYIYLGSKKMEGKYSLGLLLEGKLAGAMQLETKALV